MLIAQKRSLAILIIALAVAVTLASTENRYWRGEKSKPAPEITTQKPRPAAVARRNYVRASTLPPKLRSNLKALGDRLERRGKEQMIMYGALTRAGVAGSEPVTLNLEPAGRLMVRTRSSSVENQIIAFDGTEKSAATVAESDRALVETLVFDTADNFFWQQMNGAATRCLGYRFRPDEQNTTGPFHDIYAVIPIDGVLGNLQGAKLFYFNSDTLLLDRITYQAAARVDVRFSNWHEANGQKVARRIERFENGTNVMTLTIDKWDLGPSAQSDPK